MRTFIAIEIPENIQYIVGEYIESVRELIPHVKWVKPENLHLTIKFLGEITESDLKRVNECITRTSAEYEPFVMGLSDIGFFPRREKPKVLWLGADGGEDILLGLFHDMEHCLEEIGFDRETRTFSPHLTIGRVRRYVETNVPEQLPEFKTTSFGVKSIAVIKSTLTPSGPIYEKIFESNLNSQSVSNLY